MPRAEVGSTKYIANKLKSKGLQRLRWYCQACEKQCRDENGFKCHAASESHLRQMMLIGENPNKVINDFTQDFVRAFVAQLRTAHYTKQVHINHFYQEYIHDKEHVHMNATKFKSLTEFAKYLGKEGICRVEETEKGLHIAWIDNSPEALRRQAAVKKQERMEKNDEEWEQRIVREQLAKAKALEGEKEQDEAKEEERNLNRAEGEKIGFSISLKPGARKSASPSAAEEKSSSKDENEDAPIPDSTTSPTKDPTSTKDSKSASTEMPKTALAPKPKNIFAPSKPKNVFAQSKPKKGDPSTSKINGPGDVPKKMTEMERIMKAEMAKGRGKPFDGPGQAAKRQRVA